MAKTKTKPTGAPVDAFIHNFSISEKQIADSYKLIEMMRAVTNEEPYMWGPSIVGFGNYHYKYPSGHEGDAPLLGFSPRKPAISLYVYTGADEHKSLLEELGKYKMGKACIYVKSLEDIDLKALNKLMKESVRYTRKKYPQQ